jgi:2-methylcitrate dehydratase PrpD
MDPAAEITTPLARFLVRSRWEDLPRAVRHEAKRTLLNALGTALGGCRDPAVEHALAVLAEFSGPPAATVIGHPARTDALTASFLNAVSVNVLDFDDTHQPTIIHPAAPVAPALLAWAERAPVAGADLLHALVLGIEVECRLGNAVTPYHYAHGWHITSTCGVVGAAAAMARLIGLHEDAAARALGLGATQAHGLVESLGTMAKSVGVGNAPRNGIVAALLARQGYTAAPRTLEGPRGFAAVMGREADLTVVDHGLGTVWESARNTYKPYPCGVVLHPVIDALLDLRAAHDLDGADVERVVVRGHPLLRQRTDRPRPASGREAQVSIQHTAAVCLLHGAAGIRQFTDAVAADPAVAALGDRVEVRDEDGLAPEAVVVAVRTGAGVVHERSVDGALGGLERPLSDVQIEHKVRDLAAFSGVACDADALIDAIWRLDELDDAAAVIRATVPPA